MFTKHPLSDAVQRAICGVALATTAAAVPNGAAALFLVDGAAAAADEMAAMEVVAVLFDGHDPAAVETARAQWRAVTGAGLAAVYWAQEGGRWVRPELTESQP